ncbi:MAG: DNA double-strand break repair nuclease NurA [Candidatus Hadarchaeales archaeon]
MFDVTPITESLEPPEATYFTPIQVQLEAFCFDEDDREEFLQASAGPALRIEDPQRSRRIVSIDGSSTILGELDGGVVGAVRACVVVREEGGISLQRYGPYIFSCTATNTHRIYSNLRGRILGAYNHAPAPHYSRMPDRIRSFLEKLLLEQAVSSFSDSLILFDGSMRVGTYDSPLSFFKRVSSIALARGNSIAAVSKRTGLTLKTNGRSILSVLDGIPYPSYVAVKPAIMQEGRRYYGDIYVCRLVKGGYAFRVDLQPECRNSHSFIFSELRRISNSFGYPEDLKIAHVMSIFSPAEVIVLQAAASAAFGMHIRDDIRRKILYPLG